MWATGPVALHASIEGERARDGAVPLVLVSVPFTHRNRSCWPRSDVTRKRVPVARLGRAGVGIPGSVLVGTVRRATGTRLRVTSLRRCNG